MKPKTICGNMLGITNVSPRIMPNIVRDSRSVVMRNFICVQPLTC